MSGVILNMARSITRDHIGATLPRWVQSDLIQLVKSCTKNAQPYRDHGSPVCHYAAYVGMQIADSGCARVLLPSIDLGEQREPHAALAAT